MSDKLEALNKLAESLIEGILKTKSCSTSVDLKNELIKVVDEVIRYKEQGANDADA